MPSRMLTLRMLIVAASIGTAAPGCHKVPTSRSMAAHVNNVTIERNYADLMARLKQAAAEGVVVNLPADEQLVAPAEILEVHANGSVLGGKKIGGGSKSHFKEMTYVLPRVAMPGKPVVNRYWYKTTDDQELDVIVYEWLIPHPTGGEAFRTFIVFDRALLEEKLRPAP